MKNRFRLTFLAFSCLVLLCACNAFYHRIAENYYDQYAYYKAIPNYEKILRKTFDPEAASRLADSYMKTGNSLKAEIWYRRLANSRSISLADKLNYAEALMENGKYEEAKTWLNEYLDLNSGDKRVKRLIQACDSVQLFFEDTTVYEVNLLKLNSGYETNFSPTFYKDGIVFLSDRSSPGKNKERSDWTGKEYLDLFYSHSSGDGNWSSPVLLKGDINGLYDEGPAVFTNDFNEIYFTRTDYSGKFIEKNQKNVSTLKLFEGKLVNNQWKMQYLMPFNNKDYSVGHPAITPDGKTLFFVSDMPWGYGGTDLYMVTFRNGQWTNPENLGPQINTEGNEMFPFFSADSVLYFASDGHIGLGGLDIYASYWDGSQWSKPENLQYPVNTSKDDFGFIIDKSNKSGYFSSNRTKNLDMIYGFTRYPPVFMMDLVVNEGKTGKPVREFEIYSVSKKGESVSLGKSTNGKFSLKLNPNTEYNLVIKSFGYYAEKVSVSTMGKRKSEIIDKLASLNKIEVNKNVIWPTINFPKKETDLTASTEHALDSLATILKLNPEMMIEIASHTDSRGSFIDNLNLSKKRAEEITTYLTGKGVNSSRLLPVGYGEGRLLNNCRDGILCIEEDHQVNNRVEIKVVNLGPN